MENEIVDLLTDIKMKVSWKDQSDVEVIQYIKPNQDSMEIDSKVIDLLADFCLSINNEAISRLFCIVAIFVNESKSVKNLVI